MTKLETKPINRVLLATVDELMSLAQNEKWSEVDEKKNALLSPDLGIDQSEIAQYMLDSGFLTQDVEKNGNKRDCAWTILETLDPQLIDDETVSNIEIIAEVAALTDSHIFAAGRAADLIRIWRGDTFLKKGVPYFFKEFSKLARQKGFNDQVRGEKTRLEYYRKDIPDLAKFIEKYF